MDNAKDLMDELQRVLSPALYDALTVYIYEHTQEVYWEGFDEGYQSGLNGE